MLAKSGLHLARRSGRQCPNRFFMPLVMSQAVAQDSARPVHPAYHSQPFLLHTAPLLTVLGTVGPGTRIKATKTMMMPGMIRATTNNTPVEMVSCSVKGKVMSMLLSEKGRLC